MFPSCYKKRENLNKILDFVENLKIFGVAVGNGAGGIYAAPTVRRCGRKTGVCGKVEGRACPAPTGAADIFHISTCPIYRGFWGLCTRFSTVSTWFSTFQQWNDVENLCKMWKRGGEARHGGIFCGSFKVASYAVHFYGSCYKSHKK